MIIEVLHFDRGRNKFEAVAEVTLDAVTSLEAALEYAYRWTNNISGSWSVKQEMLDDGTFNGDYNEAVKVLKKNFVGEDGREYGRRSSMMFDRMVVDGETYEVATVGFKKVA